ncbi:MAG TPA: hypothetical protein VMY43_12085 [Methanothrix sp.]|nr:hypothetical protein [Methanothrix sp.]
MNCCLPILFWQVKAKWFITIKQNIGELKLQYREICSFPACMSGSWGEAPVASAWRIDP